MSAGMLYFPAVLWKFAYETCCGPLLLPAVGSNEWKCSEIIMTDRNLVVIVCKAMKIWSFFWAPSLHGKL